MIKRNGQGRKELTRSSLKRMSDTEYAAYSEAFVAIRGDYQALCMIGDKLRELETSAQNLGQLESQMLPGLYELPDSIGDRGPWEVCMSLMHLNQSEVLLCKRVGEHGWEYAVLDHLPVASAYGKVHGPLDVLRTGDNPRQVLRDFLRSERETLELMSKDITTSVRVLIAERFPRKDLRRVVNEITRMCMKVVRLDSTETSADLDGPAQKLNSGIRRV